MSESAIRIILFFISCSVLIVILIDSIRRQRAKLEKHNKKFYVDKTNHEKIFNEEILEIKQISPASEDTNNHFSYKNNQVVLTEKQSEPVVTITNDLNISDADENCFEDDTISIIIRSNKQFGGYDLLQEILANGFEFGEMNLFHNYEKAGDEKIKLFSLASATETGSFDLSNIGALTCNGLVLFMNPHVFNDPTSVFDEMIATAEQLAEDLNGELLTVNFAPWTEEYENNLRDKL